MDVNLTHNELLHVVASVAADLLNSNKEENLKRYAELVDAESKLTEALTESFKSRGGYSIKGSTVVRMI